MRRAVTGRVLVTTVALFWALGAIAADFNETHVFNPTWTAHARFHSAFQLVLAVCTSAVAVRLVWSSHVLYGSLLAAIYPTAFLVTPLVPGVAFADPGQPAREIAGVPGQIIMAVVTLGALILGYVFARLPPDGPPEQTDRRSE